jgi:hypothetical protein
MSQPCPHCSRWSEVRYTGKDIAVAIGICLVLLSPVLIAVWWRL